MGDVDAKPAPMLEDAAAGGPERVAPFSYDDVLVGRALGLDRRYGSRWDLAEERLQQRLYYNFRSFDRNAATTTAASAWSCCDSHGSIEGVPTGGIFNLEFNCDGTLLGAACDKKSVLLFDPATKRLAHAVTNAHQASVNCIRFLDSRVFATCSDDTTVALWDSRFLKGRLRSLEGHTNLVKNIEFSHRSNCLVTSGFDGSICTWDINSYSTESQSHFNKVFYTNGLMRMRITPNWDKMVISTMNCYLMIIHDLDLETIADDLESFKPNMYRIMQISGKPLVAALKHTRLFHAKRNRVEFVEDFPPGNEAEIISSLLLHPQGWAAVSRNVSSDDNSEWCCVHDIHSYPTREDEDECLDEESNLFQSVEERRKQRRERVVSSASPSADGRRRQATSSMDRLAEFVAGPSREPEVEPVALERIGGGGARLEDHGDTSSDSSAEGDGGASASERGDGGPRSSMDIYGLLSSIVRFASQPSRPQPPQQQQQQPPPPPSEQSDSSAPVPGPSSQSGRSAEEPRYSGFLVLPSGDASNSSPGIYYFGLPQGGGASASSPSVSSAGSGVPPNSRLHHNRRRLTHYIEESNQGRGFIKEICFSPDGRIIGSPYGFGIRLLAFDQRCSGMQDCVADLYEGRPGSDHPFASRPLQEVLCLAGSHRDVVLSSAFSPHDYTLVTGCQGGKIVWHQPVL